MNSVKKKFGIIVLYSEAIVHSARDKKYGEKTPFSIKGRRGEYNDCYRYFLLKCKKMGIEAALVSSADIIGPGLFQSFWTYDRNGLEMMDKRILESFLINLLLCQVIKKIN
jgi:hypothetical protein